MPQTPADPSDGPTRLPGLVAFACVAQVLYLASVLAERASGGLFPVLHWSDEVLFHLPLVEAFASRGPFFDGPVYSTATTPLFHLLWAVPRALLGPGHEWTLRLLHASVCALLPAVVFEEARRRGGLLQAWSIGLVVLVAPYVWTRSLLLATENLAALFGLLALFAWDGSRGRFALWASLAVLTRQQWVWLAPFAVASTVRSRSGNPAWRRDMALACVPALVFVPFLVAWGGLVPPAFRVANASDGVNLRGAVFVLAAFGFYRALLVPSAVLAWVRANRVASSGLFTAAVVVSLVVGLRPADPGADGGFLWRMARVVPDVGGIDALLAGCLALGLVSVVEYLRSGRGSVVLAVLLVAASLAGARMNFQKYAEHALLAGLVLAEAARTPTRIDLVARVLSGLLGVAYFLAKAGGVATQHP